MTVLIFCLLCIITFTCMSSAQSADKEPSHSPGWIVIPVDEYRVLRAKAFPTERDQELHEDPRRVGFGMRRDGADDLTREPLEGRVVQRLGP